MNTKNHDSKDLDTILTIGDNFSHVPSFGDVLGASEVIDEDVTSTKFKIIIGEQTPAVPSLKEPPEVWVKTNRLLLLEFKEFAEGIDNALGIAANQVNHKGRRINERFFVHRLGKKPIDPFEIIVDPVIVERHGSLVTELEGCLSWPGRTIVAKRHLSITVSYWTIDGEYIENKKLDRFESQVFQHEIDHLEGVEENVQEPGSTFRRDNEKVGRNDLCPCGSLKKFKKCCGR